MLTFNPRRVFKLRNIERPSSFLVKNGFSAMAASRLLAAASPMVKIKHLESLCLLLNCTLDDLFEWKPDRDAAVPDNHPLRALSGRETPRAISDLVKDLPIKKLADLESMIDELRSS